MCAQSRTGSESRSSSWIQANGTRSRSAAAHCAMSVVLPYPAGAQTSVSLRSRPSRRRSSRSGLSISPARTRGGLNLGATRGAADRSARVVMDALRRVATDAPEGRSDSRRSCQPSSARDDDRPRHGRSAALSAYGARLSSSSSFRRNPDFTRMNRDRAAHRVGKFGHAGRRWTRRATEGDNDLRTGGSWASERAADRGSRRAAVRAATRKDRDRGGCGRSVPPAGPTRVASRSKYRDRASQPCVRDGGDRS